MVFTSVRRQQRKLEKREQHLQARRENVVPMGTWSPGTFGHGDSFSHWNEHATEGTLVQRVLVFKRIETDITDLAPSPSLRDIRDAETAIGPMGQADEVAMGATLFESKQGLPMGEKEGTAEAEEEKKKHLVPKEEEDGVFRSW